MSLARHRGLIVAIAGGACVALLLVAASASAFTYPQKAKTFTGRGVVRVKCPAGKHVLGGGLATTNFFGELRLLGSHSFRAGGFPPDRGWMVEVNNIGGHTVIVEAVCSGETPKYITRFKGIAANQQGTVSARCPSGKRLYSGGEFANRNLQSGFVKRPLLKARASSVASMLPADGSDSNTIPDDKFVVTVDNLKPHSVTAFALAICGSENQKYVAASFGVNPMSESTDAQGDVPCPANTGIIGGGAGMITTFNKGAINSTFPSPTFPGANGSWSGRLDNFDLVSHTGTVAAICRVLGPSG